MKSILEKAIVAFIVIIVTSCASTAQQSQSKGGSGLTFVQGSTAQALPIDSGLHILINKSTQRAQVKRGTNVLIESSCGTGRGFIEDEITPTGKFRIQSKELNHPSEQFGGVSMWCAMRIVRGVYIHGSDGYVYDRETGAGMPQSHGCIRLSVAMARKFFDAVEIGTPVYIIGEDLASVQKSGYLELFDHSPNSDNAVMKVNANPTPANIKAARDMWLRKKLFVKRPDGTNDRSKMLVGYPFMPESTYIPFLRFQDLILTADEKARGLRLTLDSE